MIHLFIAAQLCDLLLTAYGMRIGLAEVNPLGFTWHVVAAKIILSLMVARVIYGWPRLGKLAWLPAIVSMLAVVWNVLVIVCEVIY